MKNMKVSAKLAVGFFCMTMLILIIAAGGLYGLFRMGGISADMYENKALPLGDLATAMEYFQRLRVQTRNAIIYTGDYGQLSTVESDMKLRKEQFMASMGEYESTLATDEGRKLYNEIAQQFTGVFEPGVAAVLEGAKRGESSTDLIVSMAATTAAADTISNNLSKLIELRMNVMSAANQESIRVETLIFNVDMAVIAVTICTAIFLAAYISNLISKPVVQLYNFMDRAASTGDIRMSDEDEAVIRKYAQYKDEIGRCIGSVAKFMTHIANISDELQLVAAGDLTVAVVPLSEHDTIGLSVKKMIENLNGVFSEVFSATVQVAIGSKQVADGSQSLAHGAVEQASAVEQLSSFIDETTQKTKASAQMAASAATLAGGIRQSAQRGNTQMDNMMQAVNDINQANQSISKVMKVIDDIAFQTNILALNAAVEAARAGQHGKGFAVVADEVRNLAAKSAEAAKETGVLVLNSIEKAEYGAKIASDTSDSLREIVSGINESAQIITEISKSSNEQIENISQLNRSVDQVSSVTQRNSATAEQSSAVSEEMSSQASVLEGLVAQFKLSTRGRYTSDQDMQPVLQ